MKVGNLVEGFEVVDVKRITSLNLTAFTRDISKYLEEGYRIDVASTREVGLQKRVDMFKLGKAKAESVDTPSLKQETPIKVEVVEDILGDVSGATLTTEEGAGEVQEVVEVPVKKTTSRAKKTT